MMKISEAPLIGFLLMEVLYSYIYFHSNLSEIKVEVLYMIPDLSLKIWLAIMILSNIRGSQKKLRASVIWGVVAIWAGIIILNLTGLRFSEYKVFRGWVNNEWINFSFIIVVFIWLFIKLFQYARHEKNI